MTVEEVVNRTKHDVIVERCGIQGTILFDSDTSSYKTYKDLKHTEVARIEPDSDGGRKFLHLYVI